MAAAWFTPLDATEQAYLHTLLERLVYGPGGLLAAPDDQITRTTEQ